MGLPVSVKYQIYQTFPEDYIDTGVFVNHKFVPEGKSHKERSKWWAGQSDAFLMFALEPEIATFDLNTIRKLAKIMKVTLDPEDDEFPEDQQLVLLDEIMRNLNKAEYDEIANVLYGTPAAEPPATPDEPTNRDELWNEAERIARSILLLVARKSKSTTQEPVAVWNSRLSQKGDAGEWIRIDLRHHPNPKLRRDGVLAVHVDHRADNSTTTFQAGQQLKPEKGEKALYGKEEVEFPNPEILEIKASSKIQTAIASSPAAVDGYETDYWEECYPRDLYSHTEVYAQVGGWPLTWPEQSAEEMLDSHLVLRTYADSEPWVEIFRTGRKYEAFTRIT